MTDLAIDAVQARTIRVLQGGVVTGGMAITAAFAPAALAGEQLTGSETLGVIAGVALSVGAAAAAIPLAFVMSDKGRRVGLQAGYFTGVAGASLAVLALLLSSYPLLVVGMVSVGAGQASTQAARFAGADLATAENRASAIGSVMWASTIGSVFGPILALAVAGPALEVLGAPEYTGSYLLAGVLFFLAGGTIQRLLRPDPLHLAGESAAAPAYRPPSLADLGFIASRFGPAIGASAMALSQAVMVGVMVVASLHMLDGDQSRLMISLMISGHIVGMYAFSPWVGALVDRLGSPIMIAAGSIQLFVGAELASHTSATDAPGVLVGMFLIGSGWSFCMVAGSALLTASSPIERRVGVQATADFLMTVTGATAGIASGLVVEIYSFHDLSHWAGFVAIALAAISVWAILQSRGQRALVG